MELVVDRTWDGSPAELGEVAWVRLASGGSGLRIEVDAPFHGDPPPEGPPGPTEGLWNHEVVELFVAGEGGYCEVELGPLGHHLVLRLTGVRQIDDRALPLRFSARIDEERWYGVALLDRALLPPGPHRAAAMAIHGVGPGRRYLSSVPLPGARPDFHQPERFRPVVLP